jgi:hypothetical protein
MDISSILSISTVYSSPDFETTLQLKQFELNLEKLMQEVSNFVESEARPLPQAKRGTCCIAKFSDDDVPYRVYFSCNNI